MNVEELLLDTSIKFILSMCLDSFGEYGKISLIRVQGPPNVPPALLHLRLPSQPRHHLLHADYCRSTFTDVPSPKII